VDIEGLLRSLNAHKARYLVIGATAFPVYGYARATLDLDLFIDATDDNAARVRAALVEFGYDLTDVRVEELGVFTFEQAWAGRVEDRIKDVPVLFASLDDLIRIKEAAGRPKDLEDLRILRKLRDESRS
jgi:predicted nucleotidyltransferase